MTPERLQKIRDDVAYLKDQRWRLGKGRILRMLTDLLDHIDESRAEVWDEGYAEARRDFIDTGDFGDSTNPYRKESPNA